MTPDGGFRKAEHVLKSKDFNSIYKKGLSRKSDGVVLCLLPNGLGYSRLGFSISSKFVKRATRRNRIRRMFREIYRKTKNDLKQNVDLVLVVRADPGARASYKMLDSIFLKLARSARLLS